MKPSDALLDEYAAWCEIAMLCESCPLSERGHLALYRDGMREIYNEDGLCSILIDYDMELEDRMQRHVPDDAKPFWWPHTKAGWRARARFAWRMALECAKEMEATDGK